MKCAAAREVKGRCWEPEIFAFLSRASGCGLEDYLIRLRWRRHFDESAAFAQRLRPRRRVNVAAPSVCVRFASSSGEPTRPPPRLITCKHKTMFYKLSSQVLLQNLSHKKYTFNNSLRRQFSQWLKFYLTGIVQFSSQQSATGLQYIEMLFPRLKFLKELGSK
jgi:hypothetical protein